MTILAVELSASRLLGNVFGTSNIVWANVIGLMLLYLTIGYFIGGRWADRSPHRTTMYKIVIWGAFLSALIPLVSRPILQVASQAFVGAEAGLALGSFVAVLILFSVPITLLGTVSPFAIRLAVTDIDSAGKISGQIYAMSTIGSLIGTFLPVLFLIPELGTIRTFLVFSGILYFVAFIGLFREEKTAALKYLIMPIIVAILAFVALQGYLRPPQEGAVMLYEGESAYNYIQVQEDAAGNRYLYLNEGQGIHSQWNADNIYYGRTWDFFLTAPYFDNDFLPENMGSMLMIGLAAGTIPRQYLAVYPNLPIDGIEIDPEIIAVGEQFFEMNAEYMPSLTVYAADGRYMLNQLQKQYTVIGIDAYRPPYIPWQLTTVEFFSEIRDRLTDEGVMVINVGRTNTDRRLVDALTNTLSVVFPSIHAMDVPYSFNTILVATMQPTLASNLNDNLQQLPQSVHPLLRQVLNDGVAALVPTNTIDILFTDDRAPVETIVDSLVLNFLLEGGAEEFR
ncbi:MAG: fused MFS/spermidine synthase [Anaerolineae bacterium]|nr:fused MFS/spermidine synthase [Anaerolineae bacterium]MDQ7034573.1 fused MFS/spermidine synthase [Anaerolineae bacterium]